MDKINKRYNSLVMNYKEIEKGTSEQDIHDKRVTLRRIFPVLAAFRVKPSKVKNGEKAFKLFGQLRDIQVQILKLESVEPSTETADYLEYLKAIESKTSDKVIRFCKKKALVFPSIKKKPQVVKSKIYKKANESLTKLIKKIQDRRTDYACDIHKIRIEFKKFRYVAEILLTIENADDARLERIKDYQDLLGEIQDYEILMDGIKRFYKKRKLNSGEIIGIFENNKKTLIEKFDHELETLIQVCHDVISLNNDVLSLDADKIKPDEPASKSNDQDLMNVIDSLKQQPKKLLDDIIAVKEQADIPFIENVLSVQVPDSPVIKNTVGKKEKAVSVVKQESLTTAPKRATKTTIAKTKEVTSPTEKVTAKRNPKVAAKTVVRKVARNKKVDDTDVKQ